MIEAPTVNAMSTIALLMAIEMMYPLKRWIHVFLDNAKYRHAVLATEWLARPGCWIKRHVIPAYCPLLSLSNDRPGRAIMGLDAQKRRAQQKLRKVQRFPHRRADLPGRRRAGNWHLYGDSFTANFRIIDPAGFWVLNA